VPSVTFFDADVPQDDSAPSVRTLIKFESRKLSMIMSIYLYATLALTIAGDAARAEALSLPRTPPVLRPDRGSFDPVDPPLALGSLREEAMCPSAATEAELAEQDEFLAEPAVGFVVLTGLLAGVWLFGYDKRLGAQQS
jgi:hypothetical protein